MKAAVLFAIPVLFASWLPAGETKPVNYRVVADKRFHVRDTADKTCSVWTGLPEEIDPLLRKYGVAATTAVVLRKGEVLALFLNDRIEENLVDITQDGKENAYSARFADSGVKVKFERNAQGRKLTHVTAVVLAPPTFPKELVLRGTAEAGDPGRG